MVGSSSSTHGYSWPLLATGDKTIRYMRNAKCWYYLVFTNPNLLICFGLCRSSQCGVAPRFGSLAEMVPAHYLDQDYCITCRISKRPKSWDILGRYGTMVGFQWISRPDFQSALGWGAVFRVPNVVPSLDEAEKTSMRRQIGWCWSMEMDTLPLLVAERTTGWNDSRWVSILVYGVEWPMRCIFRVK